MRERERLIARIRQIRRTAVAPAPAQPQPEDGPTGLDGLRTRTEELEHLVEALQDSIHRESERFGSRIAELEARIQPGPLRMALSKDARERGL